MQVLKNFLHTRFVTFVDFFDRFRPETLFTLEICGWWCLIHCDGWVSPKNFKEAH